LNSASNLFKWKHFNAEIILLTVRWYLQYRLSYRDLVEMMSERGISISHTTIMRWVHQYTPELANRVRPLLKQLNDSWRCDETYIKVKGQWTYLYRAVDSKGKTIDFMLSEKRDRKAAQRYFRKALALDHVQIPRVITVDKNPAYPVAIDNLKKNDKLPLETQVRQTKYLNNIIEQDNRFIKKRTNPMLGFKSFRTAEQTITGIETIHMIKKGQSNVIIRRPFLSFNSSISCSV
jgi:IS6 family transposase